MKLLVEDSVWDANWLLLRFSAVIQHRIIFSLLFSVHLNHCLKVFAWPAHCGHMVEIASASESRGQSLLTLLYELFRLWVRGVLWACCAIVVVHVAVTVDRTARSANAHICECMAQPTTGFPTELFQSQWLSQLSRGLSQLLHCHISTVYLLSRLILVVCFHFREKHIGKVTWKLLTDSFTVRRCHSQSLWAAEFLTLERAHPVPLPSILRRWRQVHCSVRVLLLDHLLTEEFQH